MLVISGQAPAPTDPDILIRHPTVAKQLTNIRQATYPPPSSTVEWVSTAICLEEKR
jgi:hypothetical protein